ncbi:MAG TPA: alpha-galactosidase, partial [Tepidisphaeraceae bacterium]|nr:alpha-galactosidase [Tepidisphaeraceae bacterium]
ASLDRAGGCVFGSENGSSAVRKVLTNGYIYYDPGQLLDFSPEDSRRIDSFWDAAFHAPDLHQTLVAGYLECDRAEGRIVADRDRQNQTSDHGGAFNLVVKSKLHDQFLLKPGNSISSGKVLLLVSNDGHDALEYYAETVGKLHEAKFTQIINGWCSWYPYYGAVSDAEVMKNAEFVARELKPYGMDTIQIDDGYYRAFGDWEGNNRFPQGMKATASKIRALGLKPGLWIAPYCISAGTDIVKNHPDWLAHEASGELQKIEPAHEMQAQYILDVTQPRARAWLANLFKTITQDWGYDFIKTDFVEWTILAQKKFNDPTITTAEAYRLGDQVMREAMGPSRHLLDCGPGNEVVGLIDSMRIGLDRPVPENPLWNQYAGFYNSTISAVAHRYYFHNRTWINDPDHLRTKGLTIPEAQSAATIIALSGGTVISGDKLYELDRERLDILKKILPASGQSARPIDLFDNPLPELFAGPIHVSWGDWTLVGDFNTRSIPTVRTRSLAKLGLDPHKTYLAYDFWAQEFVGEVRGQISHKIDGHSVRLLSLREKTGVPQVLGTDRHMTQGAVELSDVKWNPKTNTLSGFALGKRGMNWQIAVYIPDGYVCKASSLDLAINLPKEEPVVLALVDFKNADRVEWSIVFEKTSRR